MRVQQYYAIVCYKKAYYLMAVPSGDRTHFSWPVCVPELSLPVS